MRTSLKASALLIALVLAIAAPASASTFDRAVEQCRDNVGRPRVEACMSAQGKGAEFELCRLDAAPKVRACVQEAIAARGRADLAHAIAHCRDTVGRPAVHACLHAQGHATAFESCRTKASPSVRACVRGTMISTYGRANFQNAVEHCRQTVGRPIVQECMGGRHLGNKGASRRDLESCRAKATPSVRACVRKKLRAV
jgi:hypothetical protein